MTAAFPRRYAREAVEERIGAGMPRVSPQLSPEGRLRRPENKNIKRLVWKSFLLRTRGSNFLNPAAVVAKAQGALDTFGEARH